MNIVEFPGLGIKLNVNDIAFTLFKPVYWYGILIACGFLLSAMLAMKQSKDFGFTQDDILDMLLYAGPIGIIGARVYYVIFSWDYYRYDLAETVKIWNGGLAIYGGIIAGVLTAFVFAKIRKLSPLKLFDFAIIYIPLAQAIGRWGNFFNQEAFGSNTNLPWGMTSENVRRYLSELQSNGVMVNPLQPVHPTFLYESIWDLIIFFLLFSRRKHKKADGEVFLLYLVLYGVGRFFIEGLRTDSLMLGSIRISQFLSAVFVIVSVIALVLLKNRASKITLNDVELGNSEYGTVLKTVMEQEAKNNHDGSDVEVKSEIDEIIEQSREDNADGSIEEDQNKG